ncbi:hypothetical protein DMC30DRAFT_412029 [Rhodotorula diobovata]|uniref:FAD-binding domain-containing protein n=1 Tax=Rhodotorula diobovata TaxID=5288 RepID=A0A5C5FUJ9_9BASI|nr:hypothetical protein DMC30DRAFT_412029 [Rhodotorula diobovata]
MLSAALLPRAPLASTLNLAIVGAGIGGLASAVGLVSRGFRHVTVYEAAPEIGEVGAGIQVAPNFCRVLSHFGVLERLKPQAVRLGGASVRRYINNEQLNSTSFANLETDYGHPAFVVHRGDLHKALLDRALELGAQLKTGAHIEDVDFEDGMVKVRGQKAVRHDVIIAADGIKSAIRSKMMARRGEVDETIPTGEAAYRVILQRSQMENDPELKQLIDDPTAIRWVGPDAHIVAYPIKASQAFNIVSTHISNTVGLTEDWTARASKDVMLKRFEGWNESLMKCLRLAPEGELVEWALRIHLPLTGWIDHKVVLLGDAAHATLPHIAQGAAQAGEDGAVLGTLLAKCQTREDVPRALKMYERLRKPRADWAVEMARITGENLHIPDGAAQKARDEALKKASTGTQSPDRWGDVETQRKLYGLDVVRQADMEFAKL